VNPLLIVVIASATVLICILKLRLHPALALIVAAFVTAFLTGPDNLVNYAQFQELNAKQTQDLLQLSQGKRITQAFGNTAGKIGILIALASIIGAALMRSGAAERIIRGILWLIGKKRTSSGLLFGSFTLAIPVFFDTVFYLMIPLVKSLSIRNKNKFALFLMSVIAGGVMAHSLVPPTPGPLFVAQELNIDLGIMMIGGIVVGLVTIAAGSFYAHWISKRKNLPMRETLEISNQELLQMTALPAENLPSFFWSILPVILPVILITSNTFSSMFGEINLTSAHTNSSILYQVIHTLGDPSTALLLSAIIACLLMWKNTSQTDFQKFIVEAVKSASTIILITAAGGAFGQMMQQTGVGVYIGDVAQDYQFAILPFAFIITAMIRTAQGSATVAMITAIGIVGGLSSDSLPFHPVYIALAIGCGSKIFAWMNDSAFWIITQMAGMKETETIRYFSTLLTVMALAGLFLVMILSYFFPLV